MKRFIPVLLVFASSLFGQRVVIDSFYAPSVSKFRSVTVLLPEKYQRTRAYPVLYLLHGYGGNHMDWTERTRLREYTKDMPLIVVMADAENSWYGNSRENPALRYEEFMIRDLPRWVQSRFPVDTTAQAVAGLSMGGYGSVMLAVKHPARYKFAGGLSSAFVHPREMETLFASGPVKRIAPAMQAVLGPPSSARTSPYNPYVLVSTSRTKLPYIYLVAGLQDGFTSFLGANRELADSLRARRAEYEFHELPGGHNWQFWDQQILPLLKRMREVMGF